MEKWLSVDKNYGSGDGQFVITAEPWKGRNERTGTVEVRGIGVAETKTVDITQGGAPAFITLDGDTASVGVNGGTKTITGRSNAAGLVIRITDYMTFKTSAQVEKPQMMYYYVGGSNNGQAVPPSNDIYRSEPPQKISFPASLNLPDLHISTNFDTNIPGDPGGNAQINEDGDYAFQFELTFAPNTSGYEQRCKIEISEYSSKPTATPAVIEVVQTPNGEFIELYADSNHTTKLSAHSFTYEGGDKTVYVDCNTDWNILS